MAQLAATPSPSTARSTPFATAGWMLHWAVRLPLAAMLLVYGWAKVFLLQMGRADMGDALIQFGAMSPMGVLWRMMAYSPLFQCLAGVAEVLAAGLLLWRRTAGIGAVIGAFDMGMVLLLNIGYDVPVKQLALVLFLGCVAVALPFSRRFLLSAFSDRAVPAGPTPTALPWHRAGRITRVIGPLFAVALVAVSGLLAWPHARTEPAFPVAGVYRVVQDTSAPTPQLADDHRWQQVAFGQWTLRGRARMAVRAANGDLFDGTYAVTGPDTLEVALRAPLRGEQPPSRPIERTLRLRWERLDGGGLHLAGGGQDLRLDADHETRFLYDRNFQWAPRPPVNR